MPSCRNSNVPSNTISRRRKTATKKLEKMSKKNSNNNVKYNKVKYSHVHAEMTPLWVENNKLIKIEETLSWTFLVQF